MLKIYNSLTRSVEEFKPLNPSEVTMYTCGPTVYDFAHIGNFRTYTIADVLLRALEFNKYTVKYVMNLTDVGHLTGDNQGDADTGEDRLEKSAKKEGKTAWEVAEFYTDAFLDDYRKLNLREPMLFAKATEHIAEQIELVKLLEQQGFTYKTSDGIYFDTSKFPDYGKLSDLDEIKEGARVEVNPEKKNPRDFALWKFSYPHGKSREEILNQAASGEPHYKGVRDDKLEQRHMEWDSPWGKGFPGWHIECSAMSMKYLTDGFDPFGKLRVDGKKNYTIDIHVGGIDLRSTHHPNEIAQSEAATGGKFVNYWVHGAFMLISGQRMSKSLQNNYRIYDLEKQDYDPLALRYLYLQTHYRQEMNFTFPALDAATQALTRLRNEVIEWGKSKQLEVGCAEYEQRFTDAINNDLNMPEAIAIVWELAKSDYPNYAKLTSILKFDAVLGLDLANASNLSGKMTIDDVPADIRVMIEERQNLRKQKKFTQADHLRNRIKKLGYEVIDGKKGIEIKKI